MKVLRTLLLIVLTLKLQISTGQNKTYFPNLTKVAIDTAHKVFFSYDKSSSLINKYCKSLAKTDPYYCSDSVPTTWYLVAKHKSSALKDSVLIIYSEGMSDDPEFTILTKSEKLIARIAALELYINSSGAIYSSGHVNNMYNRKRKFQIQNDTVIEIKQPYYYVGMKGKIIKGITLYQDKNSNEVVAQLPKDYEIEILLAEPAKDYDVDYNFLVRTEFGLVGWLRLTNEDLYSTVLKDLYYAGD